MVFKKILKRKENPSHLIHHQYFSFSLFLSLFLPLPTIIISLFSFSFHNNQKKKERVVNDPSIKLNFAWSSPFSPASYSINVCLLAWQACHFLLQLLLLAYYHQWQAWQVVLQLLACYHHQLALVLVLHE